MRAGAFVTGTDTGIGKTILAACLVQRWHADYWKPVQTGLAEDTGDSTTVAELAAAEPSRIHPPRHEFAAPLSPEAAGRRENVSVRLTDFSLPPGTSPIVVEGAGGVLVPLGDGASMADLIQLLGLPAVLAARTTLGTINHTLLSLEALLRRGIPVAGIVLIGAGGEDNAEAIARLGGVPVWATLPTLPRLAPAAIASAARLLPACPPLPTMGAHTPG